MPYPMQKNESAGDESCWECEFCGTKLEWTEFGDASSAVSELGLCCYKEECSKQPEYQPDEIKEWYSPE